MGDAPERLAEIDRLFAEALDLPPAERERLLDALRERDPEAAAIVAHLLALAERPEPGLGPERVLAGPLWNELSARLAAQEALPAGERIGAYRVLGEIGRGGMAVVYLAERADGAFHQRVALKLLASGAGGGDVLRRFEQERQILASLTHPSIARLLDGGMDRHGRPFIVMEHVEGRPIDDFCDERRLSIEARLELFVAVARAVQFAHRNLVVHRDLKPSNILVTDAGEVKLLDFGIAKLLDAGRAGPFAAPPTRPVMRVMTPEYASPEQFRGGAATTASDVYQLGLLLYELLTGQPAQPLRDASAAEAEEVICRRDPQRPSAAVPAAGAAAGEAARARDTTARGLVRRLAGDLDAVVAMALRKEPERRYSSCDQLLEDLHRHLAGLPVAARRGSFGYRAGKFARRHRIALAAAALFVSLLAGYAVTVTLQARRIAREAARSAAVRDFLVSLFEVSDPDQARGREISARQLLDLGGRRIETELASAPEVQAEMQGTVGEIYRRLGMYERSEALLRRSLAASRELYGGDRPELAESLGRLGRLRGDQGDFEEAEPLLRQALAMRGRLFGEESPEVAASLSDLGVMLRAQGDAAGALSLFRRALALRRRLLGDQHPLTAESMSLAGTALRRQGEQAAAEPLLRRALALRRRLLPAGHSDLGTSLHNLASLLMDRRDYAGAEPLLREALVHQRQALGEDHPQVATVLANLALVLREKGDLAGAQRLLEEALAIQRQALGEDHPDVATALVNLGRVRQERGDLRGAEDSYRAALDRYPADHRGRPVAQYNLARVLARLREYEEAEGLARQALARQRELLGGDHPSVALDLALLGSLLSARGDHAGAEPLLRQALAIQQLRGADPVPTLEALADLYDAWGDEGEAARHRALAASARAPVRAPAR